MKTAIIADFSKTLTTSESPTSWSVFVKSGILGQAYIDERNRLYGIYHDGELAGDVETTKRWWGAHMDLFAQYGLTREIIRQVAREYGYFAPRPGLREMLELANAQGIDVFIVSSGLRAFIEELLISWDCLFPNMKIYGNELIFDTDGRVVGYDQDSIVCTLNKNEHPFNLSGYDRVVLLGDDQTDLQMYPGDSLKITFGKQQGDYDILLGPEGTLDRVIKEII